MNAKSTDTARRALLLALPVVVLALVPAARAGERTLEGEWGGLDARGQTAQVVVVSGKILGFFWGGDYRDTDAARLLERGSRIDFKFATGAATLIKTPEGARLTVREVGRAPNSIDLRKN